MKAAVVLACVLGLLAEGVMAKYHQRVGIPTATKIRELESRRIAGGSGSYIGEHPFLAGLIVKLKTDETSVCGGALVGHYSILTIAQCWYDGENEGKEIEVVLGSLKLFFGGKRQYATSVYTHPKYNPDTLENDIAMVKIPYVSHNDYIKPIILPEAYFSSLEGYTAEIIGFGRTAPDAVLNENSTQRDVYVTVMGNTECRKLYGSVVTNAVMCTSGDNGKGACGGDYGGPLILRRYIATDGEDLLVGLVSFTSSAGCNAGHPTGHTRITSYLKWIQQVW